MKFSGKAFSIFLLFLFLFTCLSAEAKAATFTVTNLNDSGTGTLRQAITDANSAAGADVIEFQTGVVGTINLQTVLPDLSSDVTINGAGADLTVVRRNVTVAFRIFNVLPGVAVVLNGLTITNGRAPTINGEISVNRGGGISVEGNLTLNNCRVSNNSAEGGIAVGGGIYNTGFLTVTNSDLVGNTASSGNPVGQRFGGAIYNQGNATIDNSTISGSGGASSIHNQGFNGVFMTISRSSITNNTDAGVYNRSGGSLVVENSTISGNTGNGIRHEQGTAVIRNTTITGNNFSGLLPGSENTCRLYNSIVAGNGSLNINGSFSADSSYNLISNGSTNLVNGQNGNIVGTDSAPVNAQLAQLGNYGGRTRTHRLLNTSPAINAGNPSEFSITDQRGVVRPVGGRADIGAFEFNLTPHRYLPRGGLNAGYDQTFTAFSNVPEPVFSFAVTEGALPPGLSLSQTGMNTARLFGIPADGGTFSFTVTATNAEGFTISAGYTLIIQAGISFAGVRGRVLSADGKPVSRASVILLDANGNVIKQAFTNPFGYYRFFGIQTGEAYSFKVIAKNRRFTQQNITVNGELNDFNFIAEP